MTIPNYEVSANAGLTPAVPVQWRPAFRRNIAESKHSLPWIGALVFAVVLTFLPLEGFKDRENYLNWFTSASIILSTQFNSGLLSLLANEPLFVLLCMVLNDIVGPEDGLRLIIFTGAFFVAYQTLKANPKNAFVLIAFLLLPQVLKNHIVHLRQGFALGFFMIGWMSTRPRTRWAIMLSTPLLHSSFFFVLLLMGIGILSKRFRLTKTMVVILYTATGISISMALGLIVSALGARQAEAYEFVANKEISGLGFVFWSIPLMIMLIEKRQFFREHILEVGSLIFYLSTYFFSPFSARVFESTLLLILLSSLKMSNVNRKIILALVFTYMAIQWVMIAYGLNYIFTIGQ